MTRFLKRTDAVKYLVQAGVASSKSTLARMAMLGEGPEYVLIGKRAYYKPEWLDAWLEKPQPSSSALDHMTREGS